MIIIFVRKERKEIKRLIRWKMQIAAASSKKSPPTKKVENWWEEIGGF